MLSAILGALRVGIVPVLLNAGLLDHERALLLEDADPQLLVDDALLDALLDSSQTDLAPWPLSRPMHYTSGTTGRPRGVWAGVLDERKAAGLVAEEAELWGFDPNDRHLVCSPFHHSVAIRFGGGTLLAGGSVIVMGPFDAARAAQTIDEHRPTSSFMVPAHLQRLFAVGDLPDLASFRLIAHAGAPCPAPLKLAAIDAFGLDAVWEFYGSTEGQFTACPSSAWLDRPGTVGRARAGRELDTDDDATIWCRPPDHARWEYWRSPERTEAAWRDGWFTVGDLGRLDDDGYLFLDGRRDDLIITGGINVYPAEIEAALSGFPGVDAVGVFGLDDERWGQRVCLAVSGSVTVADLHAFAREQLAPYKRPKEIYLLEELPHTATGKLQRNRLPDLVERAEPTIS